METNKMPYDQLSTICNELIEILKQEEGLYLDLVKKESDKKSAILERDAATLLKITREQEDDIRFIDRHETQRSNLVKQISHLVQSDNEFTKISDITNSITVSNELKEKLLHHSYALREVMLTLKNISKVNQQVLEDNHQLFQTMIIELTKTSVSGYGPGENKEKTRKSIFINVNG